MARAKRTVPARDLAVRVDEENDNRLRRLALVVSSEEGRPVLPSEVHRRLFPTMLAVGESCAGCRAGTCDGSVHVRRADKNLEVSLSSNSSAAPAHDTQNSEIVQESQILTPPASVRNGQGDLFEVSPAPATADPPASKKRGRKPVVITPDSPAFSRACAKYQECFLAARGTKPKFGAREGKAIRELLEKYDVDVLLGMIERAFRDPWWAGKKGTIFEFAKDPDKWAGEPQTKADPRPTSTQDEPLPEGWA